MCPIFRLFRGFSSESEGDPRKGRKSGVAGGHIDPTRCTTAGCVFERSENYKRGGYGGRYPLPPRYHCYGGVAVKGMVTCRIEELIATS